jgi:asparagine synthase (glutamine-hydrolysing)
VSGLCGVVDWGGVVASSVVEAMLEAAPWRGADGTATWWGDGVGMGFARLAVTPEDDVEVQPFHDGRVTVIADCRLDDRQPLIHQLGDMGPWRWGPPTDVELVARAYHRWGTDCASHLLGDFAFVIWDPTQRRLLMARDPMGMRPLYYHPTATGIVFASEIKQILTHPQVPRRIHEPFIAAHLAGIYGPIEWTAYQTIHQLAPATTLTHDGTTPRTHTHWQPDPHHRIHLDTETEYAQHLKDTLTQAVADRLRTNRQPGLLLSGGMDSGSVASIAGHLHQHQPHSTPLLHTYSWAFTELPQCDERHISRHITDHYQLPTHDIPADQLWPLAHYPQHAPDPDEPYIGAYQPLIDHTLQQATNTGTRLLLGGDRGDLVVGPVFSLSSLLQERRRADLRRALLDIVEFQGLGRGAAALLRAVRHIGSPHRASPMPAWIREDFADRVSLKDLGDAPPTDPFGDLRSDRYAYVFTPQHMQGMVWSNRTYAREHIAFCDPFSDLRLVEFVLAVPQVLTSIRDKALLRQAMEGVMPEPARTGAAKILPAPLYHHGLREAGHGTVMALLDAGRADEYGWVDSGRALGAYKSYQTSGVDVPLLWRLIALEMWLARIDP